MDWGKWANKLLTEMAIGLIPVLVAGLTLLQEDVKLPLWAAPVVAGVLVAVKLLGNWLKHRRRLIA